MENTQEKPQERRAIGEIYKSLADLGNQQAKKETRGKLFYILLELKQNHGQIISTEFLRGLWKDKQKSTAKTEQSKRDIISKNIRYFLKENERIEIKEDYIFKKRFVFDRTTGEKYLKETPKKIFYLIPIPTQINLNGGLKNGN